jgi:hypothetical protein
MTIIRLQTRQSEDSATASVGIDISYSTYGFATSGWGIGATGNYPGNGLKVHLLVYGLDAGAKAQFTIESSENAFETLTQHATCFLSGSIGATSPHGDEDDAEGVAASFPVNPQHFIWGLLDQNLNAIPFGTSSAVLRVNLVSISGGYVDYEAWFQF